jgi:3-hydroxyisobutyrate dehydrogenase-like beta-hydroxyacid dehydrogenase
MERNCNQTSIGLIGIGLVGAALAERLLAGGYTVIGYDIAEERRRCLRQLGGRAMASPAEVAGVCRCVLLSLPHTAAVQQVVAGPQGLLTAPELPAYVIDTTTGDPDETVVLAQQLSERGICYLDATISGSSGQVREAQATFMVGGDKAAFAACESLFQMLGKQTFYLGPSGSGSKAKLATNLVLGLNRLALAEGLVFAEKLGLDLDAFLRLLKASPAYSVAVDVKGERMVRNEFTPQSRIAQHRKDVSLIIKYGTTDGQQLPLSQVHLDILDKAIAAGDGQLDTSAVIREIRRRRRDVTPSQLEDTP